jgi:hypothetical protein
MGDVSLDRCSSVQELCDIDTPLSHNQSITSRSTLACVIGVSGSKDVVRDFNNSKSAVHLAACSFTAWSAAKFMT